MGIAIPTSSIYMLLTDVGIIKLTVSSTTLEIGQITMTTFDPIQQTSSKTSTLPIIPPPLSIPPPKLHLPSKYQISLNQANPLETWRFKTSYPPSNHSKLQDMMDYTPSSIKNIGMLSSPQSKNLFMIYSTTSRFPPL